jgi:GNAT superfamily N-acetyltransferase
VTSVRPATPADRARVLETLVAAFAADPVLRYLFPDDPPYAQGAPVFFGALFDKRVARDAVWVAEDGLAAALWDPADSADSTTGAADLSRLPEDVLQRVDAYDQAVHDALPAEDFWYLGVLGTHPSASGRGLGRAVMSAGVASATAQQLPCVLETSSLANVDFYGRGGWEVVGEIAAPVPTWILRRDASRE